VLNPGLYNPERTVFPNSARAEAARRAASYLGAATAYRKQEIDDEFNTKAAKFGSDYSIGSSGPPRLPTQQRNAAGDWGSAARGLGELATNVTGLVGMFRGQGSSPLPSWGSSFQTPSVPSALTAAAVAPSAFNPSSSFSSPAWTFPSSFGGR